MLSFSYKGNISNIQGIKFPFKLSWPLGCYFNLLLHVRKGALGAIRVLGQSFPDSLFKQTQTKREQAMAYFRLIDFMSKSIKWVKEKHFIPLTKGTIYSEEQNEV